MVELTIAIGILFCIPGMELKDSPWQGSSGVFLSFRGRGGGMGECIHPLQLQSPVYWCRKAGAEEEGHNTHASTRSNSCVSSSLAPKMPDGTCGAHLRQQGAGGTSASRRGGGGSNMKSERTSVAYRQSALLTLVKRLQAWSWNGLGAYQNFTVLSDRN